MSGRDDKPPPPGGSGEFESEPSTGGFGAGQTTGGFGTGHTTGGFSLPPKHIGQAQVPGRAPPQIHPNPYMRVTAPGLPIERNDAPQPVAPPPKLDVAAKAPSLELGRKRRESVIVAPIVRPPDYGRWVRNIAMVVIAFAAAVWGLNQFRRMLRSEGTLVPLVSPAPEKTPTPSTEGAR